MQTHGPGIPPAGGWFISVHHLFQTAHLISLPCSVPAWADPCTADALASLLGSGTGIHKLSRHILRGYFLFIQFFNTAGKQSYCIIKLINRYFYTDGIFNFIITLLLFFLGHQPANTPWSSPVKKNNRHCNPSLQCSGWLFWLFFFIPVRVGYRRIVAWWLFFFPGSPWWYRH